MPAIAAKASIYNRLIKIKCSAREIYTNLAQIRTS